MLLQLIVAATTSLSSDTVPELPIDLLGEPVAGSVAAVEESAAGAAAVPAYFASMSGFPAHEVAIAPELGLTPTELDNAVAAVGSAVGQGTFPGAAIAIGRWDRTVVERGFGTLDWTLGSPAVDPDRTLYDLASLTKVVATTTAVMLLVEDGTMELDAPVWRYLPGFSGGAKDRVTIRHLLTHTSGLPAGARLRGTPEDALYQAITTPLVFRPGEKVVYSDIGFVVLWAAAEAAYGGSLEQLLRDRVFAPLGMHDTRFLPGLDCVACAPTDDRPGFQGFVHDPIARQLGGVAGNAGLFSTAHDLSRFAAMLASAGTLDGVQILRPSTILLFTRRQPGADTRALGWDTPDQRGEGAAGLRISPDGFGHTGFTGTSLWVDPVRGTWVVLLSNRTYQPRGPNRIQQIRRELNDRVAAAVQ